MSSQYQQYVGIAHNPTTDECEWSIFTGNDALTAAKYRVAKWCDRPGWIGFVRPTDDPVESYR